MVGVEDRRQRSEKKGEEGRGQCATRGTREGQLSGGRIHSLRRPLIRKDGLSTPAGLFWLYGVVPRLLLPAVARHLLVAQSVY